MLSLVSHGNLGSASVIVSRRHRLIRSVPLFEAGIEILRRKQLHRDCRNRTDHRRQESRSAGGVDCLLGGRPQPTRPRRRSDAGGRAAAGSWMALPLGDRNRHRAVFSVTEGSFVPIGERTSDNGVRVQEKSPLDVHSGFLPCRCFFYGFGSVAVSGCTAPGYTGGGRARPPFWTAWIGSAGWAQLMPRPRDRSRP